MHFGWFGVLFCSMNESYGANVNFISRKLGYMVIARTPHHATAIRSFRCVVYTFGKLSAFTSECELYFWKWFEEKHTLRKIRAKKHIFQSTVYFAGSISSANETKKKWLPMYRHSRQKILKKCEFFVVLNPNYFRFGNLHSFLLSTLIWPKDNQPIQLDHFRSNLLHIITFKSIHGYHHFIIGCVKSGFFRVLI